MSEWKKSPDRRKKFLISVEEFIRCSHQLEQVLIQDKHNGTDGYRIRSLYFDTLDNKDFVEKEEGIETEKRYDFGCTIRQGILPCWK